jgi:hypothetical protein
VGEIKIEEMGNGFQVKDRRVLRAKRGRRSRVKQ